MSVARPQGSNEGASRQRRWSHRERCGASRKQLGSFEGALRESPERPKDLKTAGYTRIIAGEDELAYFVSRKKGGK